MPGPQCIELRRAGRVPPRVDVQRARRAVVAAIGATALLPARRSVAQPRVFRIGMLESIPAEQNAGNLDALRRGLREHGYVEGRNLVIDYRSADGRADRFAGLAADLVRSHVDVIVARGTPATRAAQRATTSVPVVMATMGDPRTLVASYARPGELPVEQPARFELVINVATARRLRLTIQPQLRLRACAPTR